jgi:phage terminase large subunit GpA-like protein
LTVSEWADKNRKLSSENSAEPGQWKTERAPYQREIMDAVNDPEIEKVVVMSSSQVGKSETLNNMMAYFIDCDPGPMLLIQPTIDLAESYSKERIAPMIRDSEPLHKKVSDVKTRDTNNTILMKVFPGGFLAMGGANSPAGLASRPIRILLADEIDRYPVSAGTEGDPLALAERRTTTFWNRKKIYMSTPTIKDTSRIEFEYKRGTQEKWCIECPHCGEYQYLNMYGMKFEHSKDEKGNYFVRDVTFQCRACLEKYDEFTWKSQKAEWIADNPDVKGVKSFHLNAFVSPWCSWESIIKEWLESKGDPEKLKVVVNTLFGVPFEEKGEIEDEEFLLNRREHYDAEIPEGTLILTAGVDVQDDRLEYEIVGWGKGDESWGIEYGVIHGRPDQKKVWQDLEDRLLGSYSFKNGLSLNIACACIDSGGHFTSEVYKFCKKHEYRRIFAIKGHGGPGIPLVYRIYRSKKENAAVFILGVDSGKSTVVSRLLIKEPSEGYCHFPKNEILGYDQLYFKGLIAEKLVKRKVKGQIRLIWEKIGQRNEPFDLRNYAYAALKILNPSYDRLEKRFKNAENVDKSSEKSNNSDKKLAKIKRGVIKKGIAYFQSYHTKPYIIK